VEIRISQKPKKETRLKTRVNSCHRSHQDKKKKMTEDLCLQIASELLPACSNQATNDECQHFWNMVASALMNYNDTVDLSFKKKLWACTSMQTVGFTNFVIILISTQITHLKPTSKLVHLKCTLKVSILRTIFFHLSILKNPSLSPLSQHINSILSQSFPTESTSPATTSSGKDINIQVLLE